MLFNSVQFLIFFPLTTAMYFLTPFKYRWLVLLSASCIFYAAFVPVYIFLLLATILVDYFAAIIIEKSKGRKRKIILIFDIVFSLGILFTFKYFNFFNANITALADLINWNYSLKMLQLILPIGISFYTFQSLSYVIEVYWGKQKAERHVGIYALYVMFYPQLVAGPIERPGNLLRQLKQNHRFEYQRVTDGLKLMVWGLFKKVVIADRVAMYVDKVFANPTHFEGITFIFILVFFSFQIYCDFSGYSDIAIGAAQVMGIKLKDNFNRPYHAKSVAEFWKRWHISLMTWFRDYVYIPLGGSHVTTQRWIFNVSIIFLISGLWHGANWTFIFWGMLNGFYIIFGKLTKGIRGRFVTFIGLNRCPFVHKSIQIIITFSLITFSWIFFRANSMADAFYISTHLFSGIVPYILLIVSNLNSFGLDKGLFNPIFLDFPRSEFLIAGASIIIMEIVHLMQRHNGMRQMLRTKPVFVRWSVYYSLMFCLISFAMYKVEKPFIYFQF